MDESSKQSLEAEKAIRSALTELCHYILCETPGVAEDLVDKIFIEKMLLEAECAKKLADIIVNLTQKWKQPLPLLPVKDFRALVGQIGKTRSEVTEDFEKLPGFVSAYQQTIFLGTFLDQSKEAISDYFEPLIRGMSNLKEDDETVFWYQWCSPEENRFECLVLFPGQDVSENLLKTLPFHDSFRWSTMPHEKLNDYLKENLPMGPGKKSGRHLSFIS